MASLDFLSYNLRTCPLHCLSSPTLPPPTQSAHQAAELKSLQRCALDLEQRLSSAQEARGHASEAAERAELEAEGLRGRLASLHGELEVLQRQKAEWGESGMHGIALQPS